MTAFDYAVLVVIGVSLLLGIMRGVVKECLALAGWVAAFWVAKSYAAEIMHLLPADIPTDALRTIAAFLVLFLGTLLVASLLTIAIAKIIQKIGLGWLDALLGGIFGLARGVLIVCVVMLLAGMTSMPKQPSWKNAMFSAPLEAMVKMTLPWLPDSISKQVKFE